MPKTGPVDRDASGTQPCAYPGRSRGNGFEVVLDFGRLQGLGKRKRPSVRVRWILGEKAERGAETASMWGGEHASGGRGRGYCNITYLQTPEPVGICNADLDVMLRHLTLEALLEREDGRVDGILQFQVGVVSARAVSPGSHTGAGSADRIEWRGGFIT